MPRLPPAATLFPHPGATMHGIAAYIGFASSVAMAAHGASRVKNA
ncbi:MAG TPA: hypothetical protein VHX20_00530 [Terracidiphilus sp.]|nr:hypothetical protein [Terracidiphilus sp.]